MILALPVGQGERTSLRSMTRQIVSGVHAGGFFCGFEQVGVKNGKMKKHPGWGCFFEGTIVSISKCSFSFHSYYGINLAVNS